MTDRAAAETFHTVEAGGWCGERGSWCLTGRMALGLGRGAARLTGTAWTERRRVSLWGQKLMLAPLTTWLAGGGVSTTGAPIV
jgi:hypothetical protein